MVSSMDRPLIVRRRRGSSNFFVAAFFAVGHGRWLNHLMLEQPETGENRGIAIVSLKLALSQETRASLAAVRVAQESAQRRARRQTLQARLGLALLLGAVALGALSSKSRLARWRQARASTAQPASAAPPAMAKSAPPVAQEPEPAPSPTAVAVAVAVAAPAKANDTEVPAEGCDTSTRSGLWRRSPEACARAFAADPQNASLALAVAQAEHAHAHLDEAARWARRALALDPNAAEAYVIIARADVENGRDEDARTAYQHYLEIAPRGWHKAEARAALRRASSLPRGLPR
jgi:tetratricopeptide (TPR) repeat protein